MLAARVAVAAGEEGKALELYGEALGGSRTLREAFGHEALQALGQAGPALEAQLRAQQPAEPQSAPPPSPRFRCEQCGVGSVTWHWRCPSCRSWDSLQSVNNRAL
jgi:hypothetical protein